MDSWCLGSARPADASCGHITAPQSPRVWHTVPAVGRPELCPAVKAAWRTGCSQSGTSEQELEAGGGCAQRPGEGPMSEARSGWVPSPHCEIPSEDGGLGRRDGQELRGIHRHRGPLNLVQLMDRKTQLWALKTLVKSPNTAELSFQSD